MRSLTLPLIDEAELYDRITTKRRGATRQVLSDARPIILDAYSTYRLEQIYDLTSVIDDDSIKAALDSNYPVLRSGSLSLVGGEILARSRICCLCGVRPTAELDHFLPKTKFPEFSALTINLVPVCGVCNKRKGNEWVTPAGDPLFLHAYLVNLPLDRRFLRAHLLVDLQSVSFTFFIKRIPDMTKATTSLLRAQFDYFDLQTAYRENAIELLAEKAGAIKDYYADGGAEQVRVYLRREARSVARSYGLNHWKTASLHALSRSDEFCEGGFRLL